VRADGISGPDLTLLALALVLLALVQLSLVQLPLVQLPLVSPTAREGAAAERSSLPSIQGVAWTGQSLAPDPGDRTASGLEHVRVPGSASRGRLACLGAAIPVPVPPSD
jgi:hypothetical protein